MTDTKAEKRAVKRPTNIEESSYARIVWQVKPENAATVEDLLKPDYWAHVANRFRAGHRIEAIPDDRHYFAEFIVLGASTNWAKLVLLRKIVLIKDNEKSTIEGYTIGWTKQEKWRVTQGSEILTKNHDDKKAATAWLTEHMKNVR